MSDPTFKEKIKYLSKQAHSFYDSKYNITHKIEYCTDNGFFVTGLIFYNYSIVTASDKFLALTELKYEEKHYMFHNANGDYIRILKNGNYVIIDDPEDEIPYDYLSANNINLQDILKSYQDSFIIQVETGK